MENEIMNFGENEIMEETVATGKKGLGAGKVALIGAGVILAIAAGVKLVKKKAAARKAKQECQDEYFEDDSQ